MTALGALAWSLEARAQGRWQAAMEGFRRDDRTAPSPPGSLLMVGSSSIRLWHSAARDFAPLPVVRRGFGGGYLSDVLEHAATLFDPHQPSVILLYAGENDIADGATPVAVQRSLNALDRRLAGTPAGSGRRLFLSLKPSPARWRLWPQMQRTNALIAENPRWHFVDGATPLLAANGRPDPALFLADALHLNAEGYRRWLTILRPIISEYAVSSSQL